MPGGFHVASAYVDIHAEDAGLRGEIQRAIKDAAAGADGKVKLNLDTGALRSKVEAAIKEAAAGAKGEVKLDLDASSLRGKIDAALAGATSGNRAKIKIDLDAADLRGKIDAAMAGAGAGSKVKVGIDLDTSELNAKVDAAVAAAGAGKKVKVGIDLDENELRGKVSAAVAAAGAGQRVRVRMDVDRGGLNRAEGALGNIRRDLNRINNLGDGGGGGGGGGRMGGRIFGVPIAGIAAALSMAEPIIGSLLPGVKNLGVASAALVPALAGVAMAGAALVIGTRGVGTAMRDAKKDAAAYGAGLDNLAPAAADFVKQTAGMNGAFSQMRLPIQQELFKGMAAEMTRMGQTALPVLTAGLTGMAGILNTSFKGVASTLSNLASDGTLGKFMGGVLTAFKPLAQIPGQLTNAFVKIGTAASPLLTSITRGMGSEMSKFSDYIDRTFASGALQANITKAGQAIGTFFKNFAGNSAVQEMMNNMRTQGPQVANALQQIGQGALHLLNSSSGIGTALLKVGGGLAHIVNAVPQSVLQPLLLVAGGMNLIGKAAPLIQRASTAMRGMGGAMGVISGGAAAMTNVSVAATRAGSAMTGGALSLSALQARAAAMQASNIAVRGMSDRLTTAGAAAVTFAAKGGAAASTTARLSAVLKGAAVSTAAIITGFAAGSTIAKKIAGPDMTPGIKKMAQDFTNFNAVGKLTGQTAKALGSDFGKFGDILTKASQNRVGDGLRGKIQGALEGGLNKITGGLFGSSFANENKKIVDSVDKTLASLVKAGKSDVAGQIYNQLAKSADHAGQSTATLAKKTNDYHQALRDQAAAEKVAAMSMGTFGNEAIKTQKILQANQGQVQGLQGSYNALGRFQATVAGAQLGYNQSVSQASSLLKQHSNALSMQGGLLNTTTPKAQAAASAMLNIAESAKKAGEAFTAKGDMAATAQTYDKARAAIMKLGQAQGLTAAQAREFTNQVLPIDRAKLWGAAIQNTAAQMKTLNTAMMQSPKQSIFNFDPNKFTSQARSALDAIKGVTTKTLDNGKIQIKVDTAAAQSQVRSLGKVFDSLKTKGTQTVKMPTQDVAGVTTALKAAGMAVKNLGGGKIKITAQDGASVVIQGVKSKLDALTKAGASVKVAAPNIKGADTSVGKSIASQNQFVAGISKAGTGIAANDTKQKKFNTSVGQSIQGQNQFVAGISKIGSGMSTAAQKAAEYDKTYKSILNDPRLQAHAKGLGTLGASLGAAAPKAKQVGDALSKLGASGKGVNVRVQISGTEQIGKLTALNAVKNKNVQVHVNISGTEQIGKLTALNAVKNKNVQVSVNISGTEQIGKLTALNAVKNKVVQVSVNISGTEQINKLTALNKVNNKSINVQVNISGAESINKLQGLNKVNNKSITVSVHITGADQVNKLQGLNKVNNKSITVSVHVSGADQVNKLKALNQVNNKNVRVNVSVSGADQISKLKQLNSVANKNIRVSVSIGGNISQLAQLKSFPSSKTIRVTVSANMGPINQIKSAVQGLANKHVTVTVSANAGPINQVKSAIQSISNKHVTVTVSANAGPINQVKSAIQSISNKTVTVTVSANAGPVNALKSAIAGITSKSVTVTATAPTGQVNALKAAISSVQGKSVTVTANVNGLGQVQALISAIAAVQSKTVTVTVNTVKTGSAATGGYMSSASLPGFSTGGSSYVRSYRSAGEVVGPGTGTSDSILARISNGEFIIRAAMVKKYGPEFLAGINNGAYNPFHLMKKWGWDPQHHGHRRGRYGHLRHFSSGGSTDDTDKNLESNSAVSDSKSTGITYSSGSASGNVGLSDLYRGAHNSAVLLIQKALKDIYPDFDYSSGPGTFGPRTQAYYSKFQRSLGFSGGDADGIPGIQSLTALMNRTGEFQIKAAATTVTYVVKWGDTLTSIARKFGTSVDELVKLNHIKNPDRIYAGERLKVPSIPGSGHIPAVIPGTKPGDWNYLAPPNFSKIARKQDSSTDADGNKKSKDVSEVDDITLYMGASTYRDNRFFSNLMGTNSDTIAGKVADATDVKGLASDLDKLRELGFKAFEPGSKRDAFQSYIAQGGKIELQYEKNLLEVNKALEDAKSKQDELNGAYKSLVESVGQAVQQFATLTKVGGAGGNTDTMIRQMTRDAGTVTQFQQGIAALQGRGLNATTMAQIAQSGPVEGLRTVKSLLQATPEQLKKINDLQAQINTAGGKIATSAADAMYGAGIQAANGLVDGLKASQAAIQDQMKKIAMAMETALKQALGIQSPSRVMFGHGENTIKGLILGMQKQGKSVEEIVRAIVDKVTGTAAQAASTATPAGSTTTTTASGEHKCGDWHFNGGIHVHIDGSKTDLTNATDRKALCNQIADEMFEALRERERKRK